MQKEYVAPTELEIFVDRDLQGCRAYEKVSVLKGVGSHYFQLWAMSWAYGMARNLRIQ